MSDDDRANDGTAPDMTVQTLCARYSQLYAPVVADVLDDRGLWHQIMDSSIASLTLNMKVAGPVFTVFGMPERNVERSIRKGAAAIDQISDLEIVVMETSGDTGVGHWGELLTNGAMQRGGRGAVIDGGIRDTAAILKLGFPVFCKFRSPADARGRWNVTDIQVPVTCGGVRVHPGDIIVGDADGVVVVPRRMAVEVLAEAEAAARTESEIRTRIQAGESVGALYAQYERF